MLSMIIMGSVISALAILSVMAKISPRFLKICLGYEAWIDLTLSILISVYVGFSGTISGMVIGACTGLFIGTTLFIAARTIGYTRFEKDENGNRIEKSYAPVWTVAKAKELFFKHWNKLAEKYDRSHEFGFNKEAA